MHDLTTHHSPLTFHPTPTPDQFVHDSALWLQLRYRADEALHAAMAAAVAATAAATEPAAGSGTGAAGVPLTAVGGARARSSVRFEEPGRGAPERPAAAAAATAAAPSAGAEAGTAAPAVEVPWGKREPLRIAEFEAVRQASIDDMQASAGLKHARDYLRFDLNADMQVWALLTGGGRGRPCRIVMYTDVCILNQTTLQLEYHLKDDTRHPILPRKPEAVAPGGGGGGGEAAGSTKTALSLLRTRSDPSQSMPELRLKVRAAYHRSRSRTRPRTLSLSLTLSLSRTFDPSPLPFTLTPTRCAA